MAELRDLTRFEYNPSGAVTINTVHPDFTNVNNFVSSGDLLAGTYAIVVNVAYTNSDRNHKSIWRVSTDGGATWSEETYTEVKDVDNVEVDEWVYVVNHSGGALNIILQGSKDNSSLVAEVLNSIITLERKMV